MFFKKNLLTHNNTLYRPNFVTTYLLPCVVHKLGSKYSSVCRKVPVTLFRVERIHTSLVCHCTCLGSLVRWLCNPCNQVTHQTCNVLAILYLHNRYKVS